MASELSKILPRVLIVSRRTVRKNKFVDFVGEYHLDLIVSYGAVPVIVPRVAGLHMLLESFEPIHGVLLCEGEDIDPSHYVSGGGGGSSSDDESVSKLSQEEMEEIRRLHVSDTTVDREKDSIELRLAKLCLERNIPFLGICRGSQVLNVACGGTLYQDVDKELPRAGKERVVHIDYDNYDDHRHPVRVVEGTPLHAWFGESLKEGEMELQVNSYHHQGVKRLAERFVPMAFALDGLIEGFYEPDAYNPDEGKFIMGLQFHPERMRSAGQGEAFDYPGCPATYQEFVKAVIAYQKKVNCGGQASAVGKGKLKMDQEMEKKRKVIVRSFSIAKNMYYAAGREAHLSKEPKLLEVGAEFLESNTALSVQQEKRLKQMGATVRNASSYVQRLKVNEEREALARDVMGKMSVEQLSELLSFYHMMGQVCSELLERKLMAS
ncbi:hypothetical protein QJS10_CPB12g00478 [Acorus calamus]|uniref:Uncharacterized protein n=1 Tax=Acorus calamus TaxID=4465 RepID=A0AAV9DPV6_ACOCL|nr:hypothetical protein QJS10_CPB12g00478 [Acorus calamus]